jgi:hypothetical protein
VAVEQPTPPFTLLLVPGTMTAAFRALSGLPIAIAALPLASKASAMPTHAIRLIGPRAPRTSAGEHATTGDPDAL